MRPLSIPSLAAGGLLALSLSACTSNPPRDPGTAYGEIGEGAVITLLKPLRVAGGYAGVWIQNGREVWRESDVNHHAPYCRFERLTVSDRDQRIEAGDYRVVRVLRALDYVRAWPPEPLAQAGFDDSPHTYLDIQSKFYLEGPDAGIDNVYCGVWEDPVEADGLSVAEMRQVGEGLFTLRLPQAER